MVLHWVENVRYFAVIWTSRTISKKQFRMGIGAIATKKYAARTFDLSDVCFIEGKSTQVKKIHSESQTLDGGAGSSAAGGKITLVGSNKIITLLSTQTCENSYNQLNSLKSFPLVSDWYKTRGETFHILNFKNRPPPNCLKPRF